MTLTVNQFAQSPVLGQMDLETQGTVVTVRVSANQATPLIAGQAVVVENSAGGVPAVLAAVQGGPVHGFLARNLKDANFPSTARAEMAMDNSIMYMNAGGAIARFGKVEIVGGTPGNVIASAGVNPIVGIAFDQATAANQLIRVLISIPYSSSVGSEKDVDLTATLAQINAGQVLIPAVAGQVVNVNDFIIRVTGAFATGTSVNLVSSATGVIVASFAEAGLTNGAVLVAGSANTTLGAGYGANLPVGEGVSIVNVGAAQTGGTNINFNVSYTQG